LARAVCVLGLFLLVSACVSRSVAPQPTRNDLHAAPLPTVDARSKDRRQAWPAFGESKSWPAVNEEPFLSEGHGVRNYLATVRANPQAREPYLGLGPGSALAPGSVLVEALTDRSTSPEEGLYVMEKLGDGNWRFLMVSREGTVDPAAGTTLCQRCHAEAVADGLFGVPRRLDPDKNSRPDRNDLPGLGVQKEKTQTRR
jgi:hypothetical protein